MYAQYIKFFKKAATLNDQQKNRKIARIKKLKGLCDADWRHMKKKRVGGIE